MILLNFHRPLSDAQIRQIENLTNKRIKKLYGNEPQDEPRFKSEESFEAQCHLLVDKVGLTAEQWQAAGSILVILPGFSAIAGVLLAELHGRMGHFPTIARLRPAQDGLFEVAEIINLRDVRENARARP